MPSTAPSPFLDALDERVLVFDGAMGTMLHAAGLSAADYEGRENCSEVLNLTRPDVVAGVHDAYLAVGADAVETNTFGGSALVLAEFDLAPRTREINRRAVEIAREVAARHSTPARPRFVAGSIGPGTRLPTLGHVDWDTLLAAYTAQVEGLVDGGPDVLLVETCQDLLQLKVALAAIADVFAARGLRLPVMAQVTIEATGTMLVGADVVAASAVVETYDMVDVVGINCATGPDRMAAHVAWLCRHGRKRVSVLPNAGLPRTEGGRTCYPLTPASLADWHERFVEQDGVSVVGGCCGTGPDHIRAVVERLGRRAPRRRYPEFVPSLASLYGAVALKQDADVLAIGERTNANGSARFKQLLEAEDWDAIVQMARLQARQGSHAVDLCTAMVGRDEKADMRELVSRLRTALPSPLVIDSTEKGVLEEALRLIGGKPLVNSINLEDGEARCDAICRLARRHGAAVIALTIDEAGMAREPERKLAVARRLHAIAVDRHGIDPADILFDPLTFTICTGNEADRKLALSTLEGIRLIAQEFPRAGILLGVSNVSFGLKPAARHVLNSVFLFHARRAGLTAAIVHSSKIVPLHAVPEEQRRAAEDLLFDRREGDDDPLARFIGLFGEGHGDRAERPPAARVEDRLRERIVDGNRVGLDDDLREALERHTPLEIINDLLLPGMKEVGDLFGSGQMQLPFVLQSAETMKAAVTHLEPYLARSGERGPSRGRIVLATVRGDVHDIGKNLVDIILTNNGYEVVNLGIKQPVDRIVAACREHGADAVGMSGLLVKSTAIMRENLEEMRREGVRVPVILGGAALTRAFATADCSAAYGQQVAYGRDAFAGLSFMADLERARADGRPSRWQTPYEGDGGGEGGARVPSRRDRPLPVHEFEPQPIVRVTVPVPPFLGSRVLDDVKLRALLPYVNEDVLFKFQWGFLRRALAAEEHAEQIRTVVRPIFHDLVRRVEEDEILRPRAVYGFFRCQSDGNDVLIDAGGETVRLSFPRQGGGKVGGRCIADYVDPDGDVVGLLAVTVGERASEVSRAWFEAGDYRNYLFLHGLGVEVAEALAEYVHRLAREDLGIAGDDPTEIRDLFHARYRGIRYAWGYPACPDMGGQVHALRLLGADRIGLGMDSDEQLHPEQSTAAIVVHHPQARYFKV